MVSECEVASAADAPHCAVEYGLMEPAVSPSITQLSVGTSVSQAKVTEVLEGAAAGSDIIAAREVRGVPRNKLNARNAEAPT